MTVVYIEKFNGQHGYKVAHTTTTGAAAAGWPRHHQTAAAVITFDGNGALILRLGTTTHTHTHTHGQVTSRGEYYIYIQAGPKSSQTFNVGLIKAPNPASTYSEQLYVLSLLFLSME